MKVRMRLTLEFAAALGLLAVVATGDEARGQAFEAPAGMPAPSLYWHANKGGIKDVSEAPAGQFAEIVTVTSKWIIVQDERGLQYPIASDRVRQFLIRWPSSTSLISNSSMLEASGPDGGSGVIVADHLDQYEGDAQSLVSATVSNSYNNYGFNYNYGYNNTLSPYDLSNYKTFGTTYFMYPTGYAPPLPLHVVGRALGNDPVRIASYGDNWYTIQPSEGGMTVTQVTIGNNTYARKGDLVYVVLENMSPRSLDVSQLVLYKKIPLRSFQP